MLLKLSSLCRSEKVPTVHLKHELYIIIYICTLTEKITVPRHMYIGLYHVNYQE